MQKAGAVFNLEKLDWFNGHYLRAKTSEEMKTLIHDKAFEKARKILGLADLHMKLENQKVTGDEKERIERLAKTFIEKGDIW